MRILEVKPDNVAADIKQARKVIGQEVGHPAKTVMIIRGKTPDIGQFADHAAVRSDAFGWRDAVWVRDERILTPKQKKNWFGDSDACAVVLDFSDQPAVYLKPDATLYAIEQAFLTAQQQGGGQ